MFRQIGEGSTTTPSVSSGRKIKIEPLSQLGRSSSECLECTAVDRYYEVIFIETVILRVNSLHFYRATQIHLYTTHKHNTRDVNGKK